MNKRNQYTAEFKTMVVLEALRKEGTVNEIAARHGINPIMLSGGSPKEFPHVHFS